MRSKNKPLLNVHTYNDFVGKFHDETDRAAAVLAGGYLDAFLEQALRSTLEPGAYTEQLFEGDGSLRSFSSKISMLYALGIASESSCRDMDLIRKTRNHFAHHIWEAAFDAPPVSQWCAEIRIVDSAVDSTTGQKVTYQGPARLRYLLAVGHLVMKIAHSPKIPASMRQLITGIK
jgi:DNA-binding MltR family transcriptional regulator